MGHGKEKAQSVCLIRTFLKNITSNTVSHKSIFVFSLQVAINLYLETSFSPSRSVWDKSPNVYNLKETQTIL